MSTTMDGYRVRLDAFEGPLDLLLFLIRKAEVDIHDIPIARITEQYMTFLRELTATPGRIDIDTAGEFLVMAATLMEIKSRMLAPKPPARTSHDTPSAPEDPRSELVRQLLEYKKFRDAAEALERRADDWRRRFPSAPVAADQATLDALAEQAAHVEVEDIDLLDLVEAFKRIAETVQFDRLGEHQVTYDDTPIELHTEDIVQHLSARAAEGEVEFSSIFTGRTRGEMIGLFLAVLELVKQRRVVVRQDRTDARIFLKNRPEEPAPEPLAPRSESGQIELTAPEPS